MNDGYTRNDNSNLTTRYHIPEDTNLQILNM